MRLEHLTPEHVRRAVALYLEIAWAGGGRPQIGLSDLGSAQTLGALLERFDSAPEEAEPRCQRYTLRLGNSRYPFMKFVVQEFLVNNEYFFSVDTHDNLDVRADAPDHAEWQQVKAWNRALRERIESAWHAAGLPTHADLRELAEGLACVERSDTGKALLLLVDDDHDVAVGLQALLEARGYDVELAADGLAALARLAHDPLPDLVLLDFEMPELDGEGVLSRMRASPRLAEVPVLLATASTIDLTRLRRVSGFLQKPYPREVLIAMIAGLLVSSRAAGLTPPARGA